MTIFLGLITFLFVLKFVFDPDVSTKREYIVFGGGVLVFTVLALFAWTMEYGHF